MENIRKRKNQINMLEGNIFSSMLKFSIPLFATSFIANLYTAADTVVVGKFAGSLCLAAVSSTSSILSLVTNLFIGVATGVNVYIARLIGESNNEKISTTIHTSILFSIIVGLMVAVFGTYFSRAMLVATGSPSDVIDLATLYLKIRFIGMPLMLLNSYGESILRSKGDTKRPLIYSTISGLVNIVLNLLLVIVFKMDVDGVAISTNVSYLVGSFLLIYALYKEEDEFHFEYRQLGINKEALKEIVFIGLPSGIQNSMFSISNIVMQSSINSLGSTVMAGSGAGNSLVAFVNCFVNSVSVSAMTFVSQNFGAKNYERIKKSIINGIYLMAIGSIFFVLVAYKWSYELVSIYTNDPIAIQTGVERFKISIYPYFIYGLLMLSVSCLRGLSKGMVATMAMIVGVCGIRILWIKTYFVTHRTMIGIMLAYPVSWIITALFTCIFLWITLKKEKVLLHNE